MNKEKILKRLKGLEKVRWIIEIAKIDTLQKLAQSTSIANHHYESADIFKEIMTFSINKLNLKNKYLAKTNEQKPKLFIYISIPSNLIKMSHDKLNNLLVQNINSETDDVIAIGNEALEFSQKKGYRILHSNLDLKHADQVISIINHAIAKNTYESIGVIALTPEIKNKPLNIFPIYQAEKSKKDWNNYTFYYSLANNFDNIANTYVVNILSAIYYESYRVFYKKKLLKHEDSLKNIDQKLEYWQKEIHKINRKIETEELVRVSTLRRSH